MKTTPPQDRFDEFTAEPDRRGAHRAPVVRHRLITFAWSALITGVLVLAGTIGLFASTGKLDIVAFIFPAVSQSQQEASAAPATLDPMAGITILNGTAREGLGGTVAEVLTKAGLTVATTSNSSETDVAKTMVFYSAKNFEGAARGVCQALQHTCVIKFTSAYSNSGTPLTLVLGVDYLAGAK
jgi:hypothetical protein